MKRLGKFLRLAHAERVLLLEATLLLGAIGLGLRLLPFGRLRRLLDHLSRPRHGLHRQGRLSAARIAWAVERMGDRKSTRLNSSHLVISYAVFCLKKKKKDYN